MQYAIVLGSAVYGDWLKHSQPPTHQVIRSVSGVFTPSYLISVSLSARHDLLTNEICVLYTCESCPIVEELASSPWRVILDMWCYKNLDIQVPVFKASFSVCCMLFLNFSNKSHNMKTLIILNNSRSPFLPTYLFIWRKYSFVRPYVPFWSIFLTKNPPISRELICNETLLQRYPCPM